MISNVDFISGCGFDGHTELASGKGGCVVRCTVLGGIVIIVIWVDGGWIIREPLVKHLIWKETRVVHS